jgi:glycosyltransferase involved in cell wall biosynthesis
MTGQPAVAVALHDGFYGAGTGAGYANRGFLRALISVLAPTVRLVVLPVYLASDSPQYQAGWHQESLDICQAAAATVRPVDNGTAGRSRFGDVPAFQHLAASTARALHDELSPYASSAAVIFLDIPFLGVPPLLSDRIQSRFAVVPRSTGLLHDPANHARIRFESDGLHYVADHNGRIAAISGYMRDHLVQDYELPASALLDLPDGLTAHEWSYEERPPALPPGAQAGFMLALGRAQPYKGWDDLLDALAQLGDQGIPVPHALLAAVTDQPCPTSYQRHLSFRIKALGLDATLLTRFDPAIRALLAHPALRTVVIPSRTEPFGRVPLEAYAAGAAPVVVTTAGGLAEQVIDGVTGLTASPADPVSLAGAIGRALSLTDDERERMRCAGRYLARTRFDYGRAVRHFLGQFAPSIACTRSGEST